MKLVITLADFFLGGGLVQGLVSNEAIDVVEAVQGLVVANRNNQRDFIGGILRLAAHDAMGPTRCTAFGL